MEEGAAAVTHGGSFVSRADHVGEFLIPIIDASTPTLDRDGVIDLTRSPSPDAD
jgi:hypothetical protein